MGRPRKDPNTTYRGKRKIRAEEKEEERKRKLEEKNRKRTLWEQGKCVGPDNEIGTFSEVGRKYGRLRWEEAGTSKQEEIKEAGRKAWGESTEEEREGIREAGRKAWVESTEEEREGMREAGRVGGESVWEKATEEEREGMREAGRVGGESVWEKATEEEREGMREAGRVGGENVWVDATEEEREGRREAGRVGGESVWEKATEEEREGMREAGRVGGKSVWVESTEEEREGMREAGRVGGESVWEKATEEEREIMREEGRQAWFGLDEEQRETVITAQETGRNTNNENRVKRAMEKYNTPGTPPIQADNNVWNCDTICRFDCVKNINFLSFVGASELTVLKWLFHHNLVDNKCTSEQCDGVVFPVALGDKCGVKCEVCNILTKGGQSGFWRMGKLGIVKMVMVTFAAVSGLSYKHLVELFGVQINKNTWTQYIKDVGMVCAETKTVLHTFGGGSKMGICSILVKKTKCF